jgi:hypothetical protein
LKLNAKYSIELTENQIDALIQVCEAYVRIAIHQMDFVIDRIIEIPIDQMQRVKNLCNELKFISARLDHNQSFGISSKLSETTKIAHDIYQQLRYKMAWDRNPDGGITVDFSPTLKIGKEKLIYVKRIDPFDDERQIKVPEKDGKYEVWFVDEPEKTKNKIEIKTIDGERWLFNLEFEACSKLSDFKDDLYWKEIK